MIDIKYYEWEICCLCQKCFNFEKKDRKMGEIWKFHEFFIWSTSLKDCITAPCVLSWGFPNIFHVVANIKTIILSTQSAQKVHMGPTGELLTFSWPFCKINHSQNIFENQHNFVIFCPILMILDSKWGLLMSGNWLVRVSCALHVFFTCKTCVLAHKSVKIDP